MVPLHRPASSESTASADFGRTPREVRAQMVQRLQVGLFGLSLMLLLVGLANIIMQHARMNDAAQAQQVQNSTSAGTTDPLADIGVVPGPEDGAAKRPASATPSSAAAH